MSWPKNVHPDYQWRATAQGNYQKDSVTIDCSDHPKVPFDELFLGQWLHIEAMDRGVWWMTIGGYHFWVRVKRGGAVTVTHDGRELGTYGMGKQG